MNPKTLSTVILLSVAFLYLQVFILPSTPILVSGDQSIYLQHATQMLDGELIYRDYDHFTLPGTDLLYLILFKIFGVRSWIAPATLVVLGSCSAGLITLISSKMTTGISSFLPGLAFVTMPFAADLDATHHWFSTLFTIAALAVAIEKRTVARLALAGVLIGMATFFTQSAVLLVVGFALFLLWERREEGQTWRLLGKKEASLLVSFLLTVTACVSYFVQAVGVKQFFYYIVVFVWKYYPADWFNTWRAYLAARPGIHGGAWVNIPAFLLIHLIVPFVYIPLLVACTMRSGFVPGEHRKRVMFLSATGFFVFLAVASAPGAVRLYAVSAPAVILLVWFLDSRPIWRWWLKPLLATVVLLAVARPLVVQFSKKAYLNLPIGRTDFLSSLAYEKCAWMFGRTHPLDPFFNDPLIAFALRLHNVSRVPILRPTDYTRPEEVQDAIQALEKFQVRYISWPMELNDDNQADRHAEGNHLGPIRQYLDEHYHVAQTFSNGDQMWERNPHRF